MTMSPTDRFILKVLVGVALVQVVLLVGFVALLWYLYPFFLEYGASQVMPEVVEEPEVPGVLDL